MAALECGEEAVAFVAMAAFLAEFERGPPDPPDPPSGAKEIDVLNSSDDVSEYSR